MSQENLESTVRAAGRRVVAALAARYRNLDIAEDAFAEACLRATEAWPMKGTPADGAAWLYRVADRAALDTLRRRRTRERIELDPPEPVPTAEDLMIEAGIPIPDERLRLIFVCCHPALGPEARVALTLRTVCRLSTEEIARAFLVSEATMAQRLVRAKQKIADAGIPFEIPGKDAWAERLESVLSTLEVTYGSAHADAALAGPHAGFAAEILDLTRVLVEILPLETEALALAALVRYAEARRPARLDEGGAMVPLAEQDPCKWDRALIQAAEAYLQRAADLRPTGSRSLLAAIHCAWSARQKNTDPLPWSTILKLYDAMLSLRDDAIVRVNRAVALAEVAGPDAALHELEALDKVEMESFAPYHAVRADLLARVGHGVEATAAYDRVLSLTEQPAERLWLERRRAAAMAGGSR